MTVYAPADAGQALKRLLHQNIRRPGPWVLASVAAFVMLPIGGVIAHFPAMQAVGTDLPRLMTQAPANPVLVALPMPPAAQAGLETPKDRLQLARLPAGGIGRKLLRDSVLGLQARKTEIALRTGDTLITVLMRAGASREEAIAAADALRPNYNLRRLQPGDKLAMVFSPAAATFDDQTVEPRLSLQGLEITPGKSASAAASWGTTTISFWGDPDEYEPSAEELAEGEALEAEEEAREAKDGALATPLPNDSIPNVGSSNVPPANAAPSAEQLALLPPPSLKPLQDPIDAYELGAPKALPPISKLAPQTMGKPPARHLPVGTVYLSGTIDTHLAKDARDAGLSAAQVSTLVKLFRYSIDFERDLHPGDSFEVLFERDIRDGQLVSGPLRYAALVNRGKRMALYRMERGNGQVGYFDQNGRTNKRVLMMTPVDGARISSKFGMRRHPILGYSKQHAGVDFAAITGTPIVAAGDGVIEMLGPRGGYGNYVRIRHNGVYATAYAHLSRYARGLKEGDTVRQGQVIGYVGSTGRSTGPHLHFEVLKEGIAVNPLALRDFGVAGLSGAEMAAFNKARVAIDEELNQRRPTPMRIAGR